MVRFVYNIICDAVHIQCLLHLSQTTTTPRQTTQPPLLARQTANHHSQPDKLPTTNHTQTNCQPLLPPRQTANHHTHPDKLPITTSTQTNCQPPLPAGHITTSPWRADNYHSQLGRQSPLWARQTITSLSWGRQSPLWAGADSHLSQLGRHNHPSQLGRHNYPSQLVISVITQNSPRSIYLLAVEKKIASACE